MLSIGRISLHYGNGTSDEGTCVKTTFDKSWFSWDHGEQNKTMLHPSSGLPEIIINKKQLESNSATFFTTASIFACNLYMNDTPVLLTCPKAYDS